MSATPRWTTGPWQAAGAPDDDINYAVVSDDGIVVATVTGGLTTAGDDEGEDGQSEANAIIVNDRRLKATACGEPGLPPVRATT